MADSVCVKVNISGRVQGVFFRMETHKAALEIGGITGYVKNLADGSVEAVFQGNAGRIEQMLSWCKTGAPMSRVDRIRKTDCPDAETFHGFDIRY